MNSKANISTTSLSSHKAANGSTLKEAVSPPPDFADPLKVLEAVIGKSLPEEKTQNGELDGDEVRERPSQLVDEVDFGGLSLQDFVRNGVCEAGEKGPEVQGTAQTVEECEYVCLYPTPQSKPDRSSGEEEKARFEDLHRSILVGRSSPQIPHSRVCSRNLRLATMS